MEATRTWEITLGARIRRARQRLPMSQAELSRRLGITRNAMNLIEMGRSDPRASRVKEIASILRVSTDYLLGMEEEYSTDAQRSAV